MIPTSIRNLFQWSTSFKRSRCVCAFAIERNPCMVFGYLWLISPKSRFTQPFAARVRAFQAEELEQPAANDRSEKRGTSNQNSATPHGSTEATGGGRGHMLHRMSPPQHPLPRPPGHPPRPFAGPSRGAGATSGGGGGGVGEGGMGALLGVASQLRPPRVSLDQVISWVFRHNCSERCLAP